MRTFISRKHPKNVVRHAVMVADSSFGLRDAKLHAIPTSFIHLDRHLSVISKTCFLSHGFSGTSFLMPHLRVLMPKNFFVTATGFDFMDRQT